MRNSAKSEVVLTVADGKIPFKATCLESIQSLSPHWCKPDFPEDSFEKTKAKSCLSV